MSLRKSFLPILLLLLFLTVVGSANVANTPTVPIEQRSALASPPRDEAIALWGELPSQSLKLATTPLGLRTIPRCGKKEFLSHSSLNCKLKPMWKLVPTPEETIRLVNSNIKVGIKGWASDYEKILAAKPDFITLQEMSFRPMASLEVNGYEGYRKEDSVPSRATVVLWDSQRWEEVATGTQILSYKKTKWAFRMVNYATLKSKTTGRVLSIVSAHACPTLKENYGCLQEFIRNLAPLAKKLSGAGPVLISGDFNNHFKSNYKDRLYWKSGIEDLPMTSTMDVFGRMKTHNGGGSIDYMYEWNSPYVTPLKQGTWPQESDHLALWSEWSLNSPVAKLPRKELATLTLSPLKGVIS